MKFMDTIKAFIGKASWTIEKNKPEILLASSIALTIGAVVTACSATIKASAQVEQYNERMDTIEKCAQEGKTASGEVYTEEDKKRDTTAAKMQAGVKIAKCALVPIGLTGGAIACEIGMYKELTKLFMLSAAAYTAISEKFKQYRGYISEKYGEEADYCALHGIKAITEKNDTGWKDEHGNPVMEDSVHMVRVTDDDDYSVLFDERSEYWEPDFIQNLDFLKAEQSHWNKILKEFYPGRPVFLNDIRKRLGLPPTELGQVVGWVYAPNDPNHNGDNEINFGIDRLIEAVRRGEEMPIDNCILLDFNVDGNVLYAMKHKKK